ncbi:MAG: efflux RND transporter periplasmic adaptor subunit [Polyangiales bacterium]
MTQGLPGTTAERLQIPDLHKRVRAQRFWLLLLPLAALVAAYLYARKGDQVPETYRTMKVERRDLVRVVESTGHLDARTRYEIPAPFAGRLTEILVKPGERVQQGQALARLDDREGVFAVRNASAAKQAASWRMEEAQGALDSALEERKRVERLAGRGLASEQELAAAKSAASRAKASLEGARAQQGAADTQLASARFTHTLGAITAPVNGVVLTAPENVGSAVTPERPLFVLADPLERMRVDVDVAEGDIGEVRVGQEANFEVLSFPDRKFQARVERLAVEPRREGGVVTYSVRLLADNSDGVLLPGMTATVKLEVARLANVLAVRDAALRFLPPGYDPAPPRSRVFLHVGPGQVRPVAVHAGLSDGAYTAIEPTRADASDNSVQITAGAAVAVGLLQASDTATSNQPGITLGGK